MPRGKTHRQNLIIPSSPKYLKQAVAFIEGLAQEMGFENDATVDIAISVSEAVNNAIVHGNKKDERKKVKIIVDTSPRQITVRVRDEGKSFCMEDVCNPLDPENLMKCNGRGILILRSLMDKVTFDLAPGGGTEVKMMKRLKRSTAKRAK
jgi:serine/threonine-protein kinase RsbW